MKITVLVENTVCRQNLQKLKPEHGISLYIEIDGKKILFDTGQSDLFDQNARKMDIDLSEVDILVISHGHFDHGGGLQHFFKINGKARVYMHRLATHRYYGLVAGVIPFYVGLAPKTISGFSDRIRYIDINTFIDPNLLLLEGFPPVFPSSRANRWLVEKLNKRLIPDKFRHEIALVLIEKDGIVILSGCSHNGIVNILEKVKEYPEYEKIKAVFGGFHIYSPISKKNESRKYILDMTKKIDRIDTVYYTGHCTGDKYYILMKDLLGDKLQTMNTGERFEI